MTNDDSSSITRRSVLRNAAIGSSSILGIQQFSGDSRATTTSPQRELTPVDSGGKEDELVSIVKESTAHETYRRYFEKQTDLGFSTNTPAVYNVLEQGERVMYAITFDLNSRNPGTADGPFTNVNGEISDVTFHVADDSIQESAAFVLENIESQSKKGTKFRIEDGELTQDSLTMSRSDSGDINVVNQTAGDVSATQTAGVSGFFSFGCSDCLGIMKALCQVGCAANAGLICTIATGGIGAIACGVLAGLVCTYVVVPADCTADDDYRHRQLCQTAGFC